MWNALHPLVLPAMLAALVPADRKNTYLGLLTFVGLIIAMLVQPMAGATSDRWLSPFGRRRPLMLLGTLFGLVFLLMLGWAGGLPWIFVGYVGLQFSSNTAQGPLQGLLADRVQPGQLGVASSIKVFIDLVSLVAGLTHLWSLMSTGPGGLTATFVVIGVLLIATAAVTILGTHEQPTRARIRPQGPSYSARVHTPAREPASTIGGLLANGPPSFWVSTGCRPSGSTICRTYWASRIQPEKLPTCSRSSELGPFCS